MTDPLSAVIASAVAEAIKAQLPAIVEAVRSAKSPSATFDEHFIRMPDVCRLLNADRGTIKRRSKLGEYPPLRRQGRNTGFYKSDLAKIFAKSEAPELSAI